MRARGGRSRNPSGRSTLLFVLDTPEDYERNRLFIRLGTSPTSRSRPRPAQLPPDCVSMMQASRSTRWLLPTSPHLSLAPNPARRRGHGVGGGDETTARPHGKGLFRPRSARQTGAMWFPAARALGSMALASGIGACAYVTGLDEYSKELCAGSCDGEVFATPAGDAGLGTADAGDGDGAFSPFDEASTTASDGAVHDRGVSVEEDCTSGCPTSVVIGYACRTGGCNTVDGRCMLAGQDCYCTSDGQCASGRCIRSTGQNDVSCGGACTGSGPRDGFNCALTNTAIPPIATTGFGYIPSNFVPNRSIVPATDTTIDCNVTYDTSTHAFKNWCSGQTPPYVDRSVVQSAGPSVDILSFRGLTLAAGATLTLTSSGAGGGAGVILAVYGKATILGAIHADGRDGASDASTPGAAGPGGDFKCGNSAGQDQGRDGHCSGGSGAGASAVGGTGPGGVGGSDVAGGAARPNAALRPLYGGCSGGASGSWACTTSGGGGGGAVQISAAGSLVIAGSVTANGGNGGSSTCQEAGCRLYGGGGGGGGSGGAILLEGETVITAGSTIAVNGGKGGASKGGGSGGLGGSASTLAGQPGEGYAFDTCGPPTQCGGGGGGAYGYLVIRSPNAGVCATTLVPAPVANASGTSCLCTANSHCASGECVDAESRCIGVCTGTGAADSVGCELLTSEPSSWSCPVGSCRTANSPAEPCTAADVPCWCTRDADCSNGKCVAWAGCAAEACTGSGTSDAFHCAQSPP